MSDQAQGLRTLADQARRDQRSRSQSRRSRTRNGVGEAEIGEWSEQIAEAAGSGIAIADGRIHEERRPARVIAVTSGKGGVGKTNFSTNLAVTLAHAGQRVIVLDADLGLANVHVVMGINPRFHVEHVMRGEKTLREILYPGPSGIQVIAGGSGIMQLANLDDVTRDGFVTRLRELDYMADVVIIDTGAGLSNNVLAFLCAVTEVIVLTTPEPTAITDAYATIKVVHQENPEARQMLVVNMAQSDQEARSVIDRLSMIAHQFLGFELDCIGVIPQDPMVSKAVRAQLPFAIGAPASPAARAINEIAAQLGYREAQAENSGGVAALLDRMARFFGNRAPVGAPGL